MGVTHFDLERWQSELETNTQRIQDIARRNPEPLGCLCPFEGAWSVAECMQHLSITSQAFISAWEAAISTRDREFGAPYAFWWRLFLAGVSDSSKMRSQTPAAFVPQASLRLDEILERYCKQRDVVAKLAKEMYISDVGGVRVTSPFASWMKYPLDFSFDLWLAHERRHLTQAEKG